MVRRILAGSSLGLAMILVTTVSWADEKDDRFDNLVRVDIFKGLKGDAEALARAMKVCEDTLKKEPDHPYALVWHGAGRMRLASMQFAKKEQAEGIKNFNEAIKELDRAVELAPKSIGTRVPRSIVYLQTFPMIPVENIKKDLMKKATDDLVFLEMQHDEAKDWDKIGTHRRGELLMALAMLNRHSNQEEKAKGYLEKIVKWNKGSKYESIATDWLKDSKLKQHNCIGCHTPD